MLYNNPDSKRILLADSGSDGGGGNNLSVIDLIYNQIAQLFPKSKDQHFFMEFPGRVLNMSNYAYDADSNYSQLTKPQSVIEEEFRLVNDIFDFDYSLGSPTGLKVSSAYNDAMNNLVPSFQEAGEIYEDQRRIRQWLLEEVPFEDESGNKKTVTRMGIYKILNDKYSSEKDQWETIRFTNKNKMPLEEYAQWLSNEAEKYEAKIEEYYNDLVVRGYYHEVRTAMGYLDIQSPAELLEDAKSRMRQSEMMSLDESEKIYPVQLQPSDWFKALQTDLHPVDLLLNPEFLRQQLDAKTSELTEQKTKLAILNANTSGDPKELEQKLASAKTTYENAKTALSKQYTDNTVMAVKLYLAHRKQNNKQADPLSVEDFNSPPPLTDDDLKKISEGLDGINSAQQTLLNASSDYTDAMNQLSEAKVTQATSAKLVLQQKISNLETDIERLQQILLSEEPSPLFKKDEGNKIEHTDVIPSSNAAVGNFFDVVVSFKRTEKQTHDQLHSNSSSSSYSVNVFFGSYAESQSQTTSSTFNSIEAHSLDTTIGFRATKVAIDRGGWFNPDLLAQTASFSWMNNVKTNEQFSSYPVAFIIAKDVTIKLTTYDGKQIASSDEMQKNFSSGGGCFCFSCSSASSEHKSNSASFAEDDGKNVIIRIPGPQIIGWILEKVPPAQSKSYQKLPDDYFEVAAVPSKTAV